MGVVSLLFTFVAMVQDLKTGKIRNWLVFGGMVLALMQFYLFVRKQNTWKAKWSVLVLFVVCLIILFMILFSLYCIGALGAGDCKLLLMIGMFFSIKKSLCILIGSLTVAALYGGLRNGIQKMIFHKKINEGIHFAVLVFVVHFMILLFEI